jgi:hypothetical protein
VTDYRVFKDEENNRYQMRIAERTASLTAADLVQGGSSESLVQHQVAQALLSAGWSVAIQRTLPGGLRIDIVAARWPHAPLYLVECKGDFLRVQDGAQQVAKYRQVLRHIKDVKCAVAVPYYSSPGAATIIDHGDFEEWRVGTFWQPPKIHRTSRTLYEEAA